MLDHQNEDNMIAGASFSLHPMSDDFIDIIKGSIHKTDTSNVWIKTDDVTTTVRGRLLHVFDVTKSILIHAANSDKHVAFQATYSIGCPGDSNGNVYLSADETPANYETIKQHHRYAAVKFALYPFGSHHYMDIISEQIEQMKAYATVTPVHYETKLEGDIIKIFDGLEQALQTIVDKGSNHTVMTVTVSMNSPSHEN